MYLPTGMSGVRRRGMGAYSGAFTLSGSQGNQTVSYVDAGGVQRSFSLPSIDPQGNPANWTLVGSDPNATFQNLNAPGYSWPFFNLLGQNIIAGLQADSSGNLGPYLPSGYGYQGTGYGSSAGAFGCGGGASLVRPTCQPMYQCMTPSQLQGANVTCGSAMAANATPCPGGFIPEIGVYDCEGAQTWLLNFYQTLNSYPAGPVAILNPPAKGTAVAEVNGALVPPIPKMVSLAGGQSAPVGAVVAQSQGMSQTSASYQNTNNGEFAAYGYGPGSALQAPGGWMPTAADVDSMLQEGIFASNYLNQGAMIPATVAQEVANWNAAYPAQAVQLPAVYANLQPNGPPATSQPASSGGQSCPAGQAYSSAAGGCVANTYVGPPATGAGTLPTMTPATGAVDNTAALTVASASPSPLSSIESWFSGLAPSVSPSVAAAAGAVPVASSGSGIMDWISANPILVGVGVLGALFVFGSGGKK